MFKLLSESKKAYIWILIFGALFIFVFTNIVIHSLMGCVDKNGCIKSWCDPDLLKGYYKKIVIEESKIMCKSNKFNPIGQNYTRVNYPY